MNHTATTSDRPSGRTPSAFVIGAVTLIGFVLIALLVRHSRSIPNGGLEVASVEGQLRSDVEHALAVLEAGDMTPDEAYLAGRDAVLLRLYRRGEYVVHPGYGTTQFRTDKADRSDRSRTSGRATSIEHDGEQFLFSFDPDEYPVMRRAWRVRKDDRSEVLDRSSDFRQEFSAFLRGALDDPVADLETPTRITEHTHVGGSDGPRWKDSGGRFEQ